MKLVMVYNSFSPADANLVCASLQSAGIDAHVANELSTLSLDGYALASGGIRVMVPEEQFAEARALIDQANQTPPETDRH
jgi:type III secretory pathway lipoprotein EscJ